MFTDKEIFNGLLNNDNYVIEFLLDSISPEIEEKVSWWFKGEYLLERITKEFIKMRFIKLKAKMRREIKIKNEISVSEVSDFCQVNFYDHLYQVEIVFKLLLREGQKRVRYQFRINPPPRDKESIITGISSEGLEDFYDRYIRLFPENQEKCDLKLYNSILYNKTITYINKNYKIGDDDIDFGIKDANDVIKKYRITESLDDYNKKDIKTDDGDKININREETIFFLSEVFGDILEEDDLEEIAEISEDYIMFIIKHKISEICAKIVLLIFYGFDHDEIRERVLKKNGEKFTRDGFKVKLNRCRDTIKYYCGHLKTLN